MNYTEVEKNIFETLSVLRNRPKMLFQGELTYDNFQNYLYGYIGALGQCFGIDVGQDITWWVKVKTKLNHPTYWPILIMRYCKDRAEEERINILIDMIEEFFQTNPKWYDGISEDENIELLDMNYIKIERNIYRTIFLLRKRSGMVFPGELTYDKFQEYLHGYTDALGHYLGLNMGQKITWRLKEKTKQDTSLHWTVYIPHYYKDSSEEERINILIDMIEEFFQTNPNWYLRE